MPTVERTATRIAGFRAPELDFQLMRLLGAATTGGGAPGEIFAARAGIENDNAYDWPAAFARQADRLVDAADVALKRGHPVSAADHLLRASSYFRSAEYFSDPFEPEALEYGLKSRGAFVRAAAHLPHKVAIADIPFEGIALPGYFITPFGGAANGRTVIVLTGFDGTGEELYFQTAVDGLARGFNVLVAEGPGQVGCMRRNPRLLFRPDFEVPVRAIVDYALARSEVSAERLALYGISFGGYFASRAAVHDLRIKALIANSAIIDLLAYVRGFVGAGDAKTDEDIRLDELDLIPDQAMPSNVKLSFKSACRRFGVSSLSGWFEKLADYRIVEQLHRIRCPALALVGRGEGAEAMRQHDMFCRGISGQASARVFDVSEGADMHCQLGNLPLSNSVVYDWLAETFDASR